MHNTQQIDRALFLLRLVLALVFIVHGWAKLGDLAAFAGFVGSLGAPAFLGYVVPFIELIGGAALLLGIWTRFFAFLLVGVMFFAIILAKGSRGFLGGYEFELVLLVVALALTVAEPGGIVVARNRNGGYDSADDLLEEQSPAGESEISPQPSRSTPPQQTSGQ